MPGGAREHEVIGFKREDNRRERRPVEDLWLRGICFGEEGSGRVCILLNECECGRHLVR